MYKIKQDVYHTATLYLFKGGRDANKIPNWSGWKVKMFECDCLPWFLLLFCIDQTIMLLSLSLTHTHMYAHIRTHTNTTTFPACLLHLLHCLWFHWAAEHISCHCTVLSALSHMRHQLCLLQPLCSDRHASAVLPLSDSHVTFPTVPISTHGARTKTFNVVGLLHDLRLLELLSDPRCTTEKCFICSPHDLEIIIFTCVYVFPNCIFMSKMPTSFLVAAML